MQFQGTSSRRSLGNLLEKWARRIRRIVDCMGGNSAHGYALIRGLMASGGSRNREVGFGPSGKLRRLVACDFIGECDRALRIRAEIGVRLEIGEHRRDVVGAREPAGKNFARNLLERDLVSLTIQGGNDFIEA